MLKLTVSIAVMLGIPFHVSVRDAKMNTLHPQSGIAVPYVVEAEDGSDLPIGTRLTAYGWITDLFMHQPWPDVVGTPTPTLFAQVTWLPPVTGWQYSDEDEKRESSSSNNGGSGHSNNNSKRRVTKKASRKSRGYRDKQRTAKYHRHRGASATSRPQVNDDDDDDDEEKGEAIDDGGVNRRIAQFDQRLPLVTNIGGHDHPWTHHPFTPLHLAYRTNILFLQHPIMSSGTFCAIDLRYECPSTEYPPT